MSKIPMPSPMNTNFGRLWLLAPGARGAADDARPSWDRPRARDQEETQRYRDKDREHDTEARADRADEIEQCRREPDDHLADVIRDEDDLNRAHLLINSYASALTDGEGEDAEAPQREMENLATTGGSMDRRGRDEGASIPGRGAAAGGGQGSDSGALNELKRNAEAPLP